MTRARWELCYNALTLEMPLLADATRDEVHDALKELATDAQVGWLTPLKFRAILPRLRTVAREHGCLEHIDTIEAAIEDRERRQARSSRRN